MTTGASPPPVATAHELGHATLSPDTPVVAGSTGQWTLVCTVGSYGIDEGGTIKLAHRFASDWQPPQFDRPGEAGYASVSTTGAASLRPHYETKGHERPFGKCLVIDVYDGCLAPGDTVTIVLGDQRQGSPGVRAQAFIESAHGFHLFIDPTNACLARPMPEPPRVVIVPDRPTELVCLVPADATPGERVDVFVKGQDHWGNPTDPPADLTLTWHGDAPAEIEGRSIVFTGPGRGQVAVEAGELTCMSNPIAVHATRPCYQRYWGDLHAQSDATVGTGSEREYFAFARDKARVDFASHQGNDFQMTDEDWQRLNDVVAAFHEDGRFVVFPGYEYSPNTPAGGDRNVWFLEEGHPILRSSHWQVPETPVDERTPAHPTSVLFERLREHAGLDNVLMGSHVGGRYADVRRYFDQELGPLVEIVSCWGVFEWMLHDALELGYVVGVMCNSDGHKGRPGAEGPGAGVFGIAGGLTCVLAESLSRRDVFAALKARRCYGTTGARIELGFEVDGQPMGSVIDARAGQRASAHVVGCGPIESLALHRGRELVKQVRPLALEATAGSRRVRVSWGGARMRGRGRRIAWDGQITLEGTRIERFGPYAFDSAADGVQQVDERRLDIVSHTTGDIDGVDLWLEPAEAGRLVFDAPLGRFELELAELDAAGASNRFDLGGMDMHVCVERYPEQITQTALHLEHELPMPVARAAARARVDAWYIKAVQADGQMAWSSPIYVRGEGRPRR